MSTIMTKKTGILVAFLVLAIASRFIILAGPSWANFSPMTSMALFAGFYFPKRAQGVLFTLIAVWISNILLNNLLYAQYYEGFSWGFDKVHLSLFALIALFGHQFSGHPINGKSFLGMNLLTVLGFFIISNFSEWLSSDITYTKDFNGLLACYTAGIPFIKNSLLSQFFFSILFFGGYEAVKVKVLANP
jgi:hypothetical protein